jgi:hypothetical protein
MIVILKTSSNIIGKKRKVHYSNYEDIVSDYFNLIKIKDIERLMNLFSPDAIIYEPFSKVTGGLKGRHAIESFLKIVIMASDALQNHIVIENVTDKNCSCVDGNHNHNAKNSCNNSFDTKVINALVTFERGNSLKARFTFGLSHDSDDNDNNYIDSKYCTIRSLRIQFIK